MSGELPEELTGIDVEADFLDDDTEDPLDVEEPEEETERITVFELGGDLYGTPVLDVDEVVETSALTRVPRTAEAVDGIMDIRGAITVVVDPWVLLDLPAGPRPWDEQLVVAFQTDDGEQPVGVRIDRIVGVEPIPVSDLDRSNPGDAPSADSPLVQGVARRRRGDEVVDRIGLLDVETLVEVAGRHPHLAGEAVATGGEDAGADD